MVGYRLTEVSNLVATLAENTERAPAARFAFVEKRKRKPSRQLHDWTVRTVVLVGWGWPELPERRTAGGTALFHAFDEGWNRSFDAYLERVLSGKTELLWLDLRSLERPVRKPVSSQSPQTIPVASVPQPVSSPTYIEGAAYETSITRYERDPVARAACLAAKGFRCTVCGFNFAEKYGELGEGYIHVHHLTPLADIAESYIVDPIRDLVPVCPNCHAMLHKRTPPLLPEELNRSLQRQSV